MKKKKENEKEKKYHSKVFKRWVAIGSNKNTILIHKNKKREKKKTIEGKKP